MIGLVNKISGHVASKFPPYVTQDDVAQDLWVWVYENVNTVADILRNDEQWETKLYGTMKRVAYTSALGAEAETNGYSPEDVFNYPTRVIKTLLPDIFDYEDWQSFQNNSDGQPRSKGLANETGNRMAMLVDVKSGYEQLDEDQRFFIDAHYRYGKDFHWIGQWYGITAKAARGRHDRAVGAIQRHLGRKSPSDMRRGYDSRRSVASNASARHQAERDWSG